MRKALLGLALLAAFAAGLGTATLWLIHRPVLAPSAGVLAMTIELNANPDAPQLDSVRKIRRRVRTTGLSDDEWFSLAEADFLNFDPRSATRNFQRFADRDDILGAMANARIIQMKVMAFETDADDDLQRYFDRFGHTTPNDRYGPSIAVMGQARLMMANGDAAGAAELIARHIRAVGYDYPYFAHNLSAYEDSVFQAAGRQDLQLMLMQESLAGLETAVARRRERGPTVAEEAPPELPASVQRWWPIYQGGEGELRFEALNATYQRLIDSLVPNIESAQVTTNGAVESGRNVLRIAGRPPAGGTSSGGRSLAQQADLWSVIQSSGAAAAVDRYAEMAEHPESILQSLARRLLDERRPEEALVVIHASVRQFHRDSAESWFLHGEAHAALNQFREVIQAYERALELDPQHPLAEDRLLTVRRRIAELRGQSLSAIVLEAYESGGMMDAVEALDRAYGGYADADVYDFNPQTYVEFIGLFLERDDLITATEIAHLGRQVHPAAVELEVLHAELHRLRRDGELATAFVTLHEVLDRDARLAAQTDELIIALHERAEIDGAAIDIELQHARAHEQRGGDEAARAVYESILRIEPTHATARARLEALRERLRR